MSLIRRLVRGVDIMILDNILKRLKNPYIETVVFTFN